MLNIAGSPRGFRTPVSAVRGRCPRPLDDGTAELLNTKRGAYCQDMLPQRTAELQNVIVHRRDRRGRREGLVLRSSSKSVISLVMGVFHGQKVGEISVDC